MNTPDSTKAVSGSYEEFLLMGQHQPQQSVSSDLLDEESKMYYALFRPESPTSGSIAKDKDNESQSDQDNLSLQDDSDYEEDIPNLNYGTFDGKNQIDIFQHIENMEKIFRLRHTPEKIRGYILKDSLGAEIYVNVAAEASYSDIKEKLIEKYGQIEDLQGHMIQQHKEIGKVPRKTGADGITNWNKIKTKSGNHLQLLHKTKRIFEKHQTNICSFPNQDYVESLFSILGDDDRHKILPQKPKKPKDLYELIVRYLQNTNNIAEEMYKLETQY